MKITRFSAMLMVTALVVAIMVIAQKILLPLVVALVVWFLVNAIGDALSKIPKIGPLIPAGLRRGLASAVILGLIWVCVEIIVVTINDMVEAAPMYQTRFEAITASLVSFMQAQRMPSVAEFMQGLNLQPILAEGGSLLSAFAGDFFLVVIYTIFLLVEQGTFIHKWKAMFKTEEKFARSKKTMERVSHSIRSYLLVKTGTNMSTALISLVVMLAVGQDFSLFWAFLIFLFNFIPTFGSIAAVGLPSIFAMLQFEGWSTSVIVFAGISAAHGIIGYMVEPRLLGRSLNISPLVILISLSVWGMIWGLIGMILAVPIMVSAMIILGAVPDTRAVAVWLSADGNIGDAEDEGA